MISIKNVSLEFDKPIFHQISLNIDDGQFVTLDGKSGCGKSTLIRMIMGDVKADYGEIIYDGRTLDDKQRNHYVFSHISYVDQIGSYYPNMSIEDHFQFYAQLNHIEDYDIYELLKRVELQNADIHQSPSVLSTGERKRFLLILALFAEKDIIIVDEPTASLDLASSEIILKLLKQCSEEGKTVICATHDQKVIDISDSVYLIEECRIKQIKTKKEKAEINRKEKEVYKVKYFRYKSKLQKILYTVIIILQCICIIGSSTVFAMNFGYSLSSQKEFETANNTGLLLTKYLDERYEDAPCGEEGYEYLSENEIEAIKNIDGVEYVEPYYSIYVLLNTFDLSVYSDEKLENTIENALQYSNDEFQYQANLYIQSYYPYQNIEHNGEKIDGIYIDENFKNVLEYHNISSKEIAGKTIVLNGMIPSYKKLETTDIGYYHIDENGNETPVTLHNILKNTIEYCDSDDFSFPIVDYIKKEEYNMIPFENSIGTEQDISIYMPVDQVEELIEKYANKENPYRSAIYMVYCDADKKEDIRLEIEKINSLYTVQDKGSDSYAIRTFDMSQINRQTLISIVVFLILLLATIIFHIYYVHIRKREIIKLHHDGLDGQIHKFFVRDARVNFIAVIAVSFVSLLIINQYFGKTFEGSSFIGLWIAVCMAINIVIYCIDCLIINKTIKRLIK